MALLTIDDLLNGPKGEVDSLIAKVAGLSETYDAWLAEEKGNAHLRAPGIHGSEVSGCARKVVYSLLNEKKVEKVGLTWKRRFKIGHAVHDMFQKDFHRMTGRSDYHISFQDEVPVAPDLQPNAAKWQIYSHADGVFTIREKWDGPPIARVVLEIKTEAPDGYEKLKAPKPEHLEQAHVYMACLDVPLVWFLYYNKGNQNYTPTTNPSFFRRYDPSIWATLEERFEKFHIAASLGQLPDRQESIICEFCPYSWTCNPACLNRAGTQRQPHSRWMK